MAPEGASVSGSSVWIPNAHANCSDRRSRGSRAPDAHRPAFRPSASLLSFHELPAAIPIRQEP